MSVFLFFSLVCLSFLTGKIASIIITVDGLILYSLPTESIVAASSYISYIWVSTDGGVTFTKKTALGSRDFRGLTIDTTGGLMCACVYNGKVYFSIDLGDTWTESIVYSASSTVVNTSTYRSIWCSQDGYKVVLIDEVHIYFSSD